MAELRGLIVNDTGSINLPSGNSANQPTTTATVQSFTTVGTTTWTCPAGVTTVEVLVVGGGGGGGFDNGGGGGGGGLLYENAYQVIPGTSYTVTVGGGGSGSSSANAAGASGGNSQFDSLIALGGGGGGSDTAGTGANGGSGGGMGGYNETPSWPAGNGTAGQGHAGGSGRFSSGGGGAGGPGEGGYGDNLNAVVWVHGRGGPGAQFSITGTPTWYAGGGGGGGAGSNIGGEGGIGGGGKGSDGATHNPVAGTANTGGGGGGGPGSTTPRTGAAGGSGIVVVRYFVDAQSDDPAGQVRFNTQKSTIETFSGTWKSKGLVTTGLQAYYDGNNYTQGSGTWSDLSGSGNNATIDGTPIKLSENGGVLDFRANSIRFRTSLVYGAANTSFSYGGWVKLMQANQSANLFPLGNYWDGGKSGFFAIATNYGGRETFAWFRNDGGDPSVQTTRAPIEPYQWYYLFIVRDHASNRGLLYINGERAAEVAFDGSYSVTEAGDANSTLGGVTHSSGFTRCMIGNVQAYNRALTPDEVRQNYNHFKSRFYEPGNSVESSTTDLEKPAIHKNNLTFYVDGAVRPSFENSDRYYWRDLASGNSAALSGAPRWNKEFGGYLSFDGSDNRGLFQNIRLGNGDKQWTAIAWMRTSTGETTLGQGSILSNRSGGPVYSMMGVNSGRMVYWTYYSSAWQQKLGTYTVNDNNWRMLSWVNHSNRTMRMYMDDKFDSFHGNSTSGNNNPIDILGGSWAGYFNGDIATIMIYENRALNHQEIMQNFEAMRRRFGR